jgi:hypothetical protein
VYHGEDGELAEKSVKAKAKKGAKNGWGAKVKRGWRQAEDTLRYRDKFPVTLAHLRCLEPQGPDEAPRGYRMKRPEPEPEAEAK